MERIEVDITPLTSKDIYDATAMAESIIDYVRRTKKFQLVDHYMGWPFKEWPDPRPQGEADILVVIQEGNMADYLYLRRTESEETSQAIAVPAPFWGDS